MLRLSHFIFFAIFVFLFLLRCSSGKDVRTHDRSGVPSVVDFLDSIEASQVIVTDEKDGFFEQIQQTDIEIQMKRTTPFPDREAAVRAYKSFLKTQVSNWTFEEKDSLFQIFTLVKSLCDRVNPRLFPAQIQLVKIKTGAYGAHVYFTRSKQIMIPENVLTGGNYQKQIPVMLHEVFHIISRYNVALQKDLYALIGFYPLPFEAKWDSPVESLSLTNPDGVSRKYAIQVPDKRDTFLAIPVIKSKFSAYRQDVPSFFDYLSFDLYEVLCNDVACRIVAKPKGTTTIPPSCTPEFFRKIKDNTQYIIHPDEILADNFMLALQSKESGDFSKFSEEGKALIEKILKRLETE